VDSDETELQVERRPEAIPGVRAVVAAIASDLAGDASFRAQLAAVELASNCIRHHDSAEPFTLRASRTALTVRVEIEDDAGAIVPMSSTWPPPDSPSGRGLRIVAAVVDRWGSSPDSTVVWFEVDGPSADGVSIEEAADATRE